MNVVHMTLSQANYNQNYQQLLAMILGDSTALMSSIQTFWVATVSIMCDDS
jgi:hypothetical protein